MPKVKISTASRDNGKNNEDAYLVAEAGDKTVLCVCDGVGGTDAGEIASGYVTKNLEKWLKTQDISSMGAKTLHREISRFVEEMHEDLRCIADDRDSSLGTTMVLAIVGEGKAVIENVGDSRCYVCQRGYLKQMTYDQSVRTYELVSGEIIDNVPERKKDSTLMQCIGDGPRVPEPARYIVSLDEEVDILLCSDGLSNRLNELNFQSQLKRKQSGEKVLDNLMDLAMKRGETDNITAILYRRRKKSTTRHLG